MAIDISQLIASAKSKVGKVAQKFDRDQSMPGFQLAQGGLGNKVKQFGTNLVNSGAVGFGPSKLGVGIDYSKGLSDSGFTPMQSSFKPAQYASDRITNYINNTYLASARDVPKAIEQIKQPGFGNKAIGVGRLGLDVLGAVPDPSDAYFAGYNYLKGTRAYGLQNPQDNGVFNPRAMEAGLKSATYEKPVGLGEALTTNKTLADIGNIAELPAVIAYGGLKAKSAKTAQEILKHYDGVVTAKNYLTNLENLSPKLQMDAIDQVRQVGNEVIPDILKRKEMQSLENKDIKEWMNTAVKFMEDRMVKAANPEINVGFNTQPLKRLPDTPKLSVEPTKSNPIQDLAIRKNSPQELAYDLARKLNNFDMGDIKLSKDQKIELQQWDNKNGNIITSRGITAVKDTPKWIEDAWKASQQPTTKPLSVEPTGGNEAISLQKSIAEGEKTIAQLKKTLETGKTGAFTDKTPKTYLKQRLASEEAQLKLLKRDLDRLSPSVEPVGGKGIKAFHGTAKDFNFSDFNESMRGVNGESSQVGYHFSVKPDEAKIYAGEAVHSLDPKSYESGNRGIVKEVTLDIRNPKRLPAGQSTARIERVKQAKVEGYDSVIDDSGNIVVFDKKQVIDSPSPLGGKVEPVGGKVNVSDLTTKVLKNEDIVRSLMNGEVFKMQLDNGRVVAFGDKAMLARLSGGLGDDVTDIIPAKVGRGKTGEAGSGIPRLILESQDDLIKLKHAISGKSSQPPQVWDHVPQGAKINEDGRSFTWKEKQYPLKTTEPQLRGSVSRNEVTSTPNYTPSPLGGKVGGEVTPTVPTQNIQPQPVVKPIAQVKPQFVTTGKIPTRKVATTLEQKSNLKQQKVKEARPLEDIIQRSEITPQEKIGFIDYLRTPDRVLKKIGLGKESDLIRQKYDDYLKELPTQIDKITNWSKQVSPESNQRIFQKLDGQDIQLTPQESKITKEIQSYLGEWADRLKLPKEKRISNYITHIFDKDFVQKEFDPDLARLIENRVAGSVYDPFTEKRLGAQGYVEDTWRALDAYVKRATRKVHMDEALGSVKEAAKKLESSQYDYVKNYVDRINMRPTKLDNLVDNSIKQLVGYKFGARPTSYITRLGRQAVYRGTLGLNFGSALRNLSQGANTFAVLGPKYTIKGYSALVKNGTKELEYVGVLRNNFIEDRVLSAGKQALQKFDKGLFYFFEQAEKINRGSAYYGAKAKALSEGMGEQDAIRKAVETVRDTQFTFGSIDTPVALQSDVVKILTQLQSFTIKQGEFLGEMIGKKDLAGLLRYGLASMAFVYSAGELIGMKPKDIIPSLRFDLPPTIQAPVEIGKALLDVPDEYGNDQTSKEKLQNIGKSLTPYIPAGSQLKKTITGVKAVNEGGVFTPSGMMKYPVVPGTSQMVRGVLFGPNNLPEAQEYYKTKPSPLGQNQTQAVLRSSQPEETYKQVLAKRAKEKELDEAKKKVKLGQSVSSIDGIYLNMDGSTVDVGKVASMPSASGFDKVKKQEATYKIVDDVLKLPIDQQEEALKKLGVTPYQAQYYTVSNSSVEAKTAFVQDQIESMINQGSTRNDVIGQLIKMRENVNGTQIASDNVLKKLVDQNIISQQDYNNLKQVKLENGQIKRKKVGRAKKVKMPKYNYKALMKPTKVARRGKVKIKRIKI